MLLEREDGLWGQLAYEIYLQNFEWNEDLWPSQGLSPRNYESTLSFNFFEMQNVNELDLLLTMTEWINKLNESFWILEKIVFRLPVFDVCKILYNLNWIATLLKKAWIVAKTPEWLISY